MKTCFNYKIVLFWFLLFFTKAYKIEAQIIVRLWEGEASAFANVTALNLIKSAEIRVKNEMKKLNTEIKKKRRYYGFKVVFNLLFRINNTTDRINNKLSEINQINNSVPLLFNRKKKKTGVNMRCTPNI